jgi:hypothetical protein
MRVVYEKSPVLDLLRHHHLSTLTLSMCRSKSLRASIASDFQLVGNHIARLLRVGAPLVHERSSARLVRMK